MSLVTKPAELVTRAERSGRPGLLARAPHWQRVELGAVVEVTNGAPFSSHDFNRTGRGLPLIRIRDLDGWTGTSYAGPYDAAHLVEPGDLLVGMDGDFNVRRWKGPRGLLNQRVCRLRVRKAEWYKEQFLEFVLPGYLDAIHAGTSAITVKHLSSRDLAAIPLPLPGLAEQERIIEALDVLVSQTVGALDAVALLQEACETTRRAVLTSAVRGNLAASTGDAHNSVLAHLAERAREPLARGDWDVPTGWVWARLGDLFDVNVGQTPSRAQRKFWNGGIPWVSSGEVAFNRITATRETISADGLGAPRRRLHPAGTVMLAMIGEGKTRGQAAILDIDAAHNQNCASIRVSASPVEPEWVFYCLMERYERSRLLGAGNNQPAMNKALVQGIALPIPPDGVRHQLVQRLEEATRDFSRIAVGLRHQSQRIEGFRRSLLRSAVRGELVAQCATGEPAERLLKSIREAQDVERTARPVTKRTVSKTRTGRAPKTEETPA